MPDKKKYLTKKQLAKRLAGLKAMILDIDGVLTDDYLYIGPDGFEIKKFHVGDGLLIVLSMQVGLEIIIMSNRPSEATTTRMKDLRVKHIIQERGNKGRLVREYIEKHGLDIDLKECGFMGNDMMDISLMHEVDLKIAVNGSHRDLLNVVDFVTTAKGGTGAVREVLELYFEGRGLKPFDFLKS